MTFRSGTPEPEGSGAGEVSKGVEEVSEGDTQPAPVVIYNEAQPASVIYNNGEREAAGRPPAASASRGLTNQERRFPEWIPLRLVRIAELPQPLAMAVRPGEEALYVALREGHLVRLSTEGAKIDSANATNIRQQTVLDISSRVIAVARNKQLGFLGITFSPDGKRLYTSSTASTDSGRISELIEWQVSGEGDISAEGRLVLSLKQPYGNNNGGDITFGPDGYLYFPFGDGGGDADPLRTGQDPSGWLGSILRIDPRPGTGAAAGEPYSIPADNPYADGEQGAPEVWLWGVRNPWRISFDSATGDLWVADVGHRTIEEVTRLPAVNVRANFGGAGSDGSGDSGAGSDGSGGGGAGSDGSGGGGAADGSAEGGYAIAGRGANLGWSAYEGSYPYWSQTEPDGHVRPTHEYERKHDPDGRCGITGGYIYRGERISGLPGVYLFSDYCDGIIRGFTSEAGESSLLLTAPDEVRSFGQGPDGEIYVMTTKALWRLEAG